MLFGGFLGLALLKFGNPPIMEKWVTAPTNVYEFVIGSPWPITWAYGLLFLLALVGVSVARRSAIVPKWLVLLPLTWLAWECLASFWTCNSSLTGPTLAHFFACTACFYLGFFCLAPHERFILFWPGLVCGLLIVIAIGWQQHFGGLEQTRQYFFLYIYPRLKEVPPDYLKKIASTRIFSTLFYPNALAGAMLLLLAAVLQMIWQLRQRFTTGARLLLIGAVALGGLACLFWSGSKGGWLLTLLLGLLWLLRLPFSPTVKRNLVIAVLGLGLASFFMRYAGFFQKGATSVSARFDYWDAALRTTIAHPLFGTGPGTFSIAYQKVKRPESEMSRLVHNDYLEQASDSGIPGLLLYSGLIIGAVIFGYPPLKSVQDPLWPLSMWFSKAGRLGLAQPARADHKEAHQKEARKSVSDPTLELPVLFALWLGVLGWSLQSFLEFGLYIPGLAWPAFAFLGFLLGRRYRPDPFSSGLKHIDKKPPSR